MTLGPPATRVQQSPTSSPNAVALRAATLSFGKKLPLSPRQTSNTGIATTKASALISRSTAGVSTVGVSGSNNPLSVTQRGWSKNSAHGYHPANTPKDSGSSTMVAANLAAARFGNALNKSNNEVGEGQEEAGETVPVRGTVEARRRQFQDDDLSPLTIASERLHNVSPITNTQPSPEFEVVDASSLEDISTLKDLFEQAISRQHSISRPSSVIHGPNPLRPVASPDSTSLAAAILATQLSPSHSTQNSRRGSPVPKQMPSSAHEHLAQRMIHNRLNSPNDSSNLSLAPPHDILTISRTGLSSTASRESMTSKVSTSSDRKSALLAATLASKIKISPSPQTESRPPKPPPPRRTQIGPKAGAVAAPSLIALAADDFSDTISIKSTNTGYSKYDTAHSSMSLDFDLKSASTTHSSFKPTPAPRRRRQSIGELSQKSTSDAALAAAVLSTASSQTVSSSPAHSRRDPPELPPPLQHLTGDSIRAASLASSRVASPAPKKPPVPPAPRRGRRKSLPLPPKTGLRETMRNPPKSPPENQSPQRRKPHLVRHHPHKHSEGERKRWRHFVTLSERKRYEGLWAANKGLLLVDTEKGLVTIASPLSAPRKKSHGHHNLQQQHVWSSTSNYTELLSDCVDSLIVRDIWSRSRLPFDHLADVWDLVDRGDKGRLSRDEFVVGIWLIDQSLKGRKLPSKVQDEVWQSVRRLGVQIQHGRRLERDAHR